MILHHTSAFRPIIAAPPSTAAYLASIRYYQYFNLRIHTILDLFLPVHTGAMPAVADRSELLLALSRLADTEDILEDNELSAGSSEDVDNGI